MAAPNSTPDPDTPPRLADPGARRIERAFSPLLAVESLGGNCYLVHNGAKDTKYGVDLEERLCTCYDSSQAGKLCKHYLRALFESGVDPLALR